MGEHEITPAPEPTAPRRNAVRGLAGLAGLAALGVATASAAKDDANDQGKNNNNKNKSSKGTLKRVETESTTESVGGNSTKSINASCPNGSSGEKVYALGGGYEISSKNLVVLHSRPDGSDDAWSVRFENEGNNNHDGTAWVVCGYFKD